MIVTYQDELGLVSVKINNLYGVTFFEGKAHFTDENDKDYKINIEHIIRIAE